MEEGGRGGYTRREDALSHSSLEPAGIHTSTTTPDSYIQRFMRNGYPGFPGLSLRSVALFMDEDDEKLGFCFCILGPNK